MINESLIVCFLEKANKRKLRMKERYETANNSEDKQFYHEAYLRALDLYSARYQMLLAFGYDVVADENNNIIGLKSILDDDIPF